MSQEPREAKFSYQGEEVVVTVRPLTWSKKNQILSQAMSYSSEGEAKFNLDHYYKECLSYMITKAPWGETNRIFLTSIDEALGAILQKLVPVPLEGAGDQNFFGSESEDSLMEKEEPQT